MREAPFSIPFSHPQAGKQSVRGKGSADYRASHLTAGGVTHTSPCVCFSTLFWRQARDLALASFSVHHCENFLGSLSIFLLLLPQALINLFGASPGTPSNSSKSKDLLRRRKAAPTAAPLLQYNSDTACIICEATIMRSFFHLYLLSHGANEDFLSYFHGDRNSSFLHPVMGKEKKSGNVKKPGL